MNDSQVIIGSPVTAAKESKFADITLTGDVKETDTVYAENGNLRRNGVCKIEEILPSEYVRVEYLQSTGTQYIDTGVVPNANTNTEIIAMRVVHGSSQFNIPFGCRDNNSGYYAAYLLTHPGTGDIVNQVHADFGSAASETSPIATVTAATGVKFKWYLVTENGTKNLYVNGTKTAAMALSAFTGTSKYTLKVGGFNNNTTDVETRNSSYNFYKIKIWNSSILVHEFIPVKRISDSKPGLYDMISKTFYTNNGTGEFNVGPEPPTIPATYKQVQYLQFTGTQVVDTGIIPSNHYTKIGYSMPTYVNDAHLFGTTQNATYYHFTPYSNSYYWGRNGSEANAGTWTAGYHTLQYNYGSSYQVILDGTALGSGTQILSSTNLLIGARHVTNFVGMVYYMEVWDKSTNKLARNYIPTVRISDNKPGLYDTVTKTFFTNSGTGTDFTVGPEIHNLPEEYTELEWIQSNNGPYINTGYNSAAYYVDTKFYMTNNGNSWQDLFCVENNGSLYNTYALRSSSSTTSLNTFNSAGQSATVSISFGALHTVSADLTTSTMKLICDGSTVVNTSISGSSNSYTMYLFNNNIGGSGGDQKATCKLYYFNIYGDAARTNPVRKFVPVKRYDGALGLYDMIGGTFHGNIGSGSFTAGPELMSYRVMSPSIQWNIGNIFKFGTWTTKLVRGGTTEYTFDTEVYKPINYGLYCAGLPSGYTRLNYLQSSGTQYINTSITPSGNHSIEYTYARTSASTSTGCLWCARGATTEASTFTAFLINGNELRADFNSISSSSYKYDDLERHVVYRNKNLVYIDSTLIQTDPVSTFTAGNYFKFFASYYNGYNGNLGNYASIKCYGIKIWNSETMIANFIPVKRTSDSVLGMFDIVSNTFFTNAGTGTFIGG